MILHLPCRRRLFCLTYFKDNSSTSLASSSSRFFAASSICCPLCLFLLPEPHSPEHEAQDPLHSAHELPCRTQYRTARIKRTAMTALIITEIAFIYYISFPARARHFHESATK
jgi:hypothetical protein